MTTQHSGHMFLGVDPGGKGAAVTVGPVKYIFQFSKMTDFEIAVEFKGVAEECDELGIPLTAILEKTAIRPPTSASRGGVMMAHYGMLKGMLLTVPIRTIEVTPSVWTRKMGRTDPKKTSYSEKKRRNRALAESLYPDREIVLETADAFLLAEYGRRFHQ